MKVFRTIAIYLVIGLSLPVLAEKGFEDISAHDEFSEQFVFLRELKDQKAFGLGTGVWVCRGEKKLLLTALHSVDSVCEKSLGGACALVIDRSVVDQRGADKRLGMEVEADFSISGSSDYENLFTLANYSEQLDLALLTPHDLADVSQPCLDSAAFTDPILTEQTYLVGFPFLVHRPSPSEFSNLILLRRSWGFVSYLQHRRHPFSSVTTADALPGNSGSVVFNLENQPIGIAHMIHTPDGLPEPGPQGFEIIPYGAATFFINGGDVRDFIEFQ